MIAETRILLIPREMIGSMWPHVAPHLLRGLTAATDVTLKQLADDLVRGDDSLWAIFRDNRVVGAFVTANYIDEQAGTVFLGVYALGGRGLDAWADLLGETMIEHARLTGASSVRFAGREAWSRVLPTFEITGRRGNEAVFERAVQ